MFLKKCLKINLRLLSIYLIGLFLILWVCDVIFLETFIILITISFIVFVIFPLVFCYSVSIQRGLLFMTFAHYPRNVDFNKPESVKLYGTRNFFINYTDDEKNIRIKLGAWHVLPNNVVKTFHELLNIDENDVQNIKEDSQTLDSTQISPHDIELVQTNLNKLNEITQKDIYEEILRNVPGTVILYLHGNAGSRTTDHRVSLYNVLRKLNYHVFVFDYRGYADSTSVPPDEVGVVLDAVQAYKYIQTITNSPVFIWGHSLGTGVGSHMLADLVKIDINQPKGFILEAPFNNIRDEVSMHSMAQILKITPWFDYTVKNAMKKNNFLFESDKHINEYHQPVCILHAEDDFIVPFKLGYKLYRTAIETRNKSFGPIEFNRFGWRNNYGHRNIYKVPHLNEIIFKFVQKYKNETY